MVSATHFSRFFIALSVLATLFGTGYFYVSYATTHIDEVYTSDAHFDAGTRENVERVDTNSAAYLTLTTKADWYNTAWEKRIRITIPAGSFSENLTNFPVYVDLRDLGTDFFTTVQNGGGDIRITKANGTTEVAREVVSCDTTGETGELHFKADGTLSSATDTVFYIYYGNSSASDYATDATYGAEAVWTENFALVSHNGGGTDSTSNGNNGTGYNSISIGTATGNIGSATSFDGVDDHISIPDNNSLDLETEWTISSWVYRTGVITDTYAKIISKWGNYFTAIDNRATEAGLYGAVGQGTGNSHQTSPDRTVNLPLSSWHKVEMKYSESTGIGTLYLDTVQTDTVSSATTGGSSYDLHIGNPFGGVENQYYKGLLDEIRISSVARSSAWVGAEYGNQSSPSSFYTLSPAEGYVTPSGTYTSPAHNTAHLLDWGDGTTTSTAFSASFANTSANTPVAIAMRQASTEINLESAEWRHLGTSTSNTFTRTNAQLLASGFATGTLATYTQLRFTLNSEDSVSNPQLLDYTLSYEQGATPPAPTLTTATPGAQSIALSFTHTNTSGYPITTYTAYAYDGTSTTTAQHSTSPVTISGLTNGATYTVSVTATNVLGESAYSNTQEVTLDGVPSAPESLSVAEIANGHSIPLTWGEPSSTGGQPITDYRIEYRQTGQPSWATFSDGVATSLSTTVTSLSNNQSYDFRVSAINNIGTSLPSNIVTAAPGEPAQVLIGSITDTTVPDIAASVTITNEGTDPYEYNYAFCVTDSSVNQCGPADGADIFSGSASKLITNGIDYTTTLTATDIPLGTYFFHLQVTFGSQTSSAHRQFTAVTAPTAPSAPTITNIVPADSTITIAFTPPENNGGADITTYTAYAYDGTSTTTAQHSTSPVTISGLTNGATYTVSLSATNSVGESPRTPTATATPEAPVVPDTTPPTITNLSPRTTLAANTTLTTLSLSTNETAQCYYATTNESDTSAMTLFTNSSDTTHSTVVYDLKNGTSYTYYVHCIDLADNQTTIATALTFSVATPTTSGGGGGGGGGRISAEEELEREYAGVPELPVSLPPAPTQSVQQDVTPQDILRLLLSLGIISEDKRAVAERMLGIYSTAIPTTRTLFTKTLSLGMTHPEVRTVQQFLNTNGCTVGHAGAGSVGNETSYFGIRTYNAVICFQERYAAEILYPLNLTQGTGYWGEKSIEKANGVGEGVL